MAWFRRRPAFEPLGSRIEREVEVEPSTTMVDASEAIALARPLALEVDPAATLGMVVGHDISPEGTSHHWDCLFDGRGVLANVNVELHLDRDGPPPVANLVALPKVPHDPASLMRQLWDGLDARGRRVYLDQWFARDPLPEPLDSVAAMASFADEGFDLVSGPTDVVLAARRTDDGPVWQLDVGRDSATRPLPVR